MSEQRPKFSKGGQDPVSASFLNQGPDHRASGEQFAEMHSGHSAGDSYSTIIVTAGICHSDMLQHSIGYNQMHKKGGVGPSMSPSRQRIDLIA